MDQVNILSKIAKLDFSQIFQVLRGHCLVRSCIMISEVQQSTLVNALHVANGYVDFSFNFLSQVSNASPLLLLLKVVDVTYSLCFDVLNSAERIL